MFDSSKDHYDSKVKYDEDTKKFKELKIFLNFKEHSYSNLKQKYENHYTRIRSYIQRLGVIY